MKVSNHVTSLLSELDEDLMLELDDVVRENQISCLPFSKSGRAEAELFDRYPELTETIERGRRAKVDSFRLQTRLQDEESYYVNAGKARPALRGDKDATLLGDNTALAVPKCDIKTKGTLEKKRSTMDMMFEMEEEEDTSTASAEATMPLQIQSPHPSDKLQKHSPGFSFAETGKSPNLAASVGTTTSSTHGSPMVNPSPPISPTYDAQRTKPWGPSRMDHSKLDMKEIMAQTSSNKVSNLSIGLARRPSSTGGLATGQAVRLSQKERKKQQQQQQIIEDSPFTPGPKEESAQDHAPKSSPWRTTSSGQKVSLKDVIGAESSGSPSASTKEPPRQASNPLLTMRQTVPGNAPALQRSMSSYSQQESTPRTMRSVPTPTISKTFNPSKSPSSVKDTASPIIQSIRHLPPLVEPSLQLSMADILAQQQTEKDVIKEAVAKRSLQEIQEEQAFQEWWDQESKKVREEEEEAKGQTVGPARERKSNSRAKGRGTSRGRGRGTGRGGGLGDEQAGDSKSSRVESGGSRGGRRSRSGKERRGRAQ